MKRIAPSQSIRQELLALLRVFTSERPISIQRPNTPINIISGTRAA